MLAGFASALLLAVVFPAVGIAWSAITRRRWPRSFTEAYVTGGGVLFLGLLTFVVCAFIYTQAFHPLAKRGADQDEPRWPDISFRGR